MVKMVKTPHFGQNMAYFYIILKLVSVVESMRFYKIPAGSLIPTIMAGDWIVTLKVWSKEKIKRREKSLNSINTCNDCNIELGLKKDTKGMVVCNPCELIREEIKLKKAKERHNSLTEEQKIEYIKYQNKYHKKLRDNLDDIYIRNQLCNGGILKSKDIPQELIVAKREQLKLKRFLEQ